MKNKFPAAVPEIPVTDMDQALDYYARKLGFNVDWGGADGGIAGISKGACRMFLTDAAFRAHHGNAAPVMIWFNLDSNEEVDELYRATRAVLPQAVEILRERVPPTFEKQVRDFLAVHDKGGQPCPRCGTRITQVSPGGFITSYCRGCQR